MLKKDLELQIVEKNEKIADLHGDIASIKRQLNDLAKQLKSSEVETSAYKDQLKQLSQSINTILQVKFPNIHEPNEAYRITEEQRLLEFLHNLCVDNSSTCPW